MTNLGGSRNFVKNTFQRNVTCPPRRNVPPEKSTNGPSLCFAETHSTHEYDLVCGVGVCMGCVCDSSWLVFHPVPALFVTFRRYSNIYYTSKACALHARPRPVLQC